MSRPDELITGGTLRWVIDTLDAAGEPVDADSNPSIQIRRGNPPADVADSVTVTKRAGTTGIYDCSYTPASTSLNEVIFAEETATISTTDYPKRWQFRIVPDPSEVNANAKIAAQNTQVV
jgi:hypothetical protein